MYGNIIWGNIYKSNITNLILTQTKIIRIINKTKYFREHTNLLFERNNILKLNSLIKYNTLIMTMHDHHNNNLPHHIYNTHKKHENKNELFYYFLLIVIMKSYKYSLYLKVIY